MLFHYSILFTCVTTFTVGSFLISAVLVARPVPAVGGFALFYFVFCFVLSVPLWRNFKRRFRDLFSFCF